VSGGGFRISRTSATGAAYGSPPRRKARYSERGPRSCWRVRRTSGAARRTRSAMHPPRLERRARALGDGAHLVDQRGRVEHEPDPLVAELGRTGEAADVLERGPEGLDDHVLLA